jgi:transporter family-2 protein
MQNILYIVLSVAMGAMLSIYLPMNSSVSRLLGSPISANVSFFLVALITAVVIFFLFGDTKTIWNVKEVPPYLYLCGFVAAFIVLGTTFLIPKLGARRFFILMLTGQILMAIIVSHVGALESPKDPITLKKVFGAALIIAGAFFSTS